MKKENNTFFLILQLRFIHQHFIFQASVKAGHLIKQITHFLIFQDINRIQTCGYVLQSMIETCQIKYEKCD